MRFTRNSQIAVNDSGTSGQIVKRPEGALPAAEELGLVTKFKSRLVSARVYEALRKHRKLTIDELRTVANPDGETSLGAVNILLSRMQPRLAKHGLAIVRGVGEDKAYRIVRD